MFGISHSYLRTELCLLVGYWKDGLREGTIRSSSSQGKIRLSLRRCLCHSFWVCQTSTESLTHKPVEELQKLLSYLWPVSSNNFGCCCAPQNSSDCTRLSGWIPLVHRWLYLDQRCFYAGRVKLSGQRWYVYKQANNSFLLYQKPLSLSLRLPLQRQHTGHVCFEDENR